MRNPRQSGDQPLPFRARELQRAIDRLQRAIDDRVAQRDELTAQLDEIHAATEARFGRIVPRDALVLDVLQQVDLEHDDVWRWTGARNNTGTPTYRVPRSDPDAPGSERTVVRLLAVAFGVIDTDDDVHLWPTTTNDDVNPWHRTLRQRGDGQAPTRR